MQQRGGLWQKFLPVKPATSGWGCAVVALLLGLTVSQVAHMTTKVVHLEPNFCLLDWATDSLLSCVHSFFHVGRWGGHRAGGVQIVFQFCTCACTITCLVPTKSLDSAFVVPPRPNAGSVVNSLQASKPIGRLTDRQTFRVFLVLSLGAALQASWPRGRLTDQRSLRYDEHSTC